MDSDNNCSLKPDFTNGGLESEDLVKTSLNDFTNNSATDFKATITNEDAYDFDITITNKCASEQEPQQFSLEEELFELKKLHSKVISSVEQMQNKLVSFDERYQYLKKTESVELKYPKAVDLTSEVANLENTKDNEQEKPISIEDELSTIKDIYAKLFSINKKMGEEMDKRPVCKIITSTDEESSKIIS